MEKIKEGLKKVKENRVVRIAGKAILWLSALFGWTMALILIVGA